MSTFDTANPFNCQPGLGTTTTEGPATLTPLAQNTDTDQDGCTDWEELATDEGDGGLRDPFNPWDFYDTDGNKIVDLFNDIFGVAFLFGSTAPGPPYNAAFDRAAPVGPNAWNLPPPDGEIDLFNDIFGVAFQFGHSCQAEP